MKRALTALVGAAAFAAPAANAATVARHKPKTKPKKRVVTVKKIVKGVQGSADRWGVVQVTLVVKKTTTIVGKRKHVKRQVVKLDVPVFPAHTGRSIFISEQVVPILEQEALAAHYKTANLDWISGATYTSHGFMQSLQSALLKAKKV